MKKNIKHFVQFGFISAAFLMCVASGCVPKKGSLVDNAGGRKPADFPELAADVFKPMDGGIELTTDEIKGRNTWNLWCAGDEQFWERMSRESYGLIDLLKTIDSRNRTNRFKTLGLINEPGFRPASKPDQYGLWIDEPIEGQGEPAEIDPKVYGHPTGIMGFRLFENPDFKGDAVKNWDGERYYKDPNYAVSETLVRPYKVGISCGSCHIAFNPCKPPADPENPKWENLASAIANQYIREGAVFAHNVKPGGLFWEMLKTQPPGTSDTSRIATDHINNPNTINPIFELGARLSVAEPEEITGDSLNLPGVTAKMDVPHVLKDGADSVGVPGATLRVYINIGSYSQHWLQQHNALIGLSPQKPFSVKTAQENSVYWLATQTKFTNVANFFMRLKSFRLEDADDGKGKDYITKDEAVMTRGKVVFAENCATCHSSKRPKNGEDETEFFRKAVLQADFRDGNFFSDDHRYPITKIKSNASRASGTNAKRGHIWAAFSSETYKKLDSVGDIEVTNPYSGTMEKFTMPDGGPGYYRTPSLISCWSSAPFLHNNSLGEFNGDPSVKGRMAAFNDAAEKLLWPEKRSNTIWRTSQECNLQIQAAVLPEPVRIALKAANLVEKDGYFRVGPIPAGTPVNLLANVDPEASKLDLAKLCVDLKKAFLKIKTSSPDEARKILREEVAPALWNVSKCPDFVEDRGHYFGSELPDADKLALIEYLKTL